MARSTRRRPASSLRVLVTGGTGFVGFHTARALHEAGHEVRLLVRSPEKMRRVLGPFGLDKLEHVKGDIADPRSVARALQDCEAVVHSAAAVNIRAADALETIRINRRGTELVIGGAVERGIARIVQVSSTTALFNPGLDVIDENSPLGTQSVGYGRSKIEADLYVRGLQQHGAGIYTTYPGSIMGPDDPGLSEAMAGLMTLLDVVYTVTSSGTQIIDVRDLAQAHVRLIERGGPPERYMMGGQFFSWSDLADILEDLVGTRLRRVRVSKRMLQAIGKLGDMLYNFREINVPITFEAVWYATEWTPSDDSKAKRNLGIEYRDIRETLGDSIVWLTEKGHLKNDKYAEHILARRQGSKEGAARQGSTRAKKQSARTKSRSTAT